MIQEKLCNLVWDRTIYPRSDLSETNVLKLFDALQSGVELPPIVVEKGTLRIIDGVHRWKALSRMLGTNDVVNMMEREFVDDNAAFLAAIELNAEHGLQMTSFEITENVVRAEKRGITLEALANAVRVPLEKIQRRLTENTGYSRHLGVRETNNHSEQAAAKVESFHGQERGERVALKGSMKPLAGKVLTEEQIAANKKAGGMRPIYYIEHLHSLIDADLWEWCSPRERGALGTLFESLSRIFSNAA
jgi:ParB-like chromosome segregation protein Spo0J